MNPPTRLQPLLDKAQQYLVGACLGMFHLPLEQSVVFSRGQGSRIWDVQGNEYIDYLLGSGPLILGHAHPAVVAAVQAQVARGATFHNLTEPAILLAERICQAVPCAETLRFVSSGTEATFYALRVARAATGREKILRFEGGWHGGHDVAQISATPSQPGGYPRPQPDCDGIPAGMVDTVLVAPFNDLATTTHIIETHAEELAGVLVEPLQRILRPDLSFLQGLREITARRGIVLIFDEIVTGFRLAWGGAQEKYGVVPDLATYGKAIGGGYPLAALGGQRELMEVLNPRLRGPGPYAFMSGTMNGHPVAAAAGLATLEELAQPGVYERLYEVGQRLQEGIEEIARQGDLSVQVAGEGPVRQIVFTDADLVDYAACTTADPHRARALGLDLIRRGIFVNPGGKLYLSTAHTDQDLAQTLEAVEGAWQRLCRGF